MFQRTGGRHDNISIAGRVGYKAFMHHGEQVIPLQPFDNGILVRGNGSRVGVIDIQAHHFGIFQIIQGCTQLVHVHDPGRAGHEILAGDQLQRKGCAGGGTAEQTCAWPLPTPADSGQGGNAANRHGAVAIAGQATTDLDQGRLGCSIGPCQITDRISRKPADGSHLLRPAIRQNLATKFLKTNHVVTDKCLIQQPFCHHHLQHPQGQGAVTARLDDDRPVHGLTGGGLVGINGPDLCPLFPGRLGGSHAVDTGGSSIQPPEDNQVTLAALCRIKGRGIPHHRLPAVILGRGTDGAGQTAGPQLMKKGMAAVTLHQPHGTGIGIGQDRLGTILRNDLLPAGADPLHRLVPADRRKMSAPLGTGPQQWSGQTLRRMHGLLVLPHLAADQPLGNRMVRVSLDLNHLVVFNGYQQTAGIRAVIGADRTVAHGSNSLQ